MTSKAIERAAIKAADARRSLISLMESPEGLVNVLGLMGIVADDNGAILTEERFAKRAVRIMDLVRDHLKKAKVHLIDPNLARRIEHMAPKMPDQKLREDDPPVFDGIAWFPERVTWDGIPLVAFSWFSLSNSNLIDYDYAVDTPCVLLLAWARVDEVRMRLGLALEDHQFAIKSCMSVVWTVGTPIGSVFGRPLEEVAELDPTLDISKVKGAGLQQLAATTWAYIKQKKSVDTHDEPLPRKSRQRYARAGIERPHEPVSVITLRPRRRVNPTGETGTGRKMDYQELVGEHWKNVWVPSLQIHRHTPIDPYWRGPEDAPIKNTDKVYYVKDKA
jgi:hypothetical protein